ncbi:Uncharacterized protein LW93_5988 [Fusarium fujikuroi]|nr:Uncharacterized protein LW93_5988 [Fusarium fujikuroi]
MMLSTVRLLRNLFRDHYDQQHSRSSPMRKCGRASPRLVEYLIRKLSKLISSSDGFTLVDCLHPSGASEPGLEPVPCTTGLTSWRQATQSLSELGKANAYKQLSIPLSLLRSGLLGVIEQTTRSTGFIESWLICRKRFCVFPPSGKVCNPGKSFSTDMTSTIEQTQYIQVLSTISLDSLYSNFKNCQSSLALIRLPLRKRVQIWLLYRSNLWRSWPFAAVQPAFGAVFPNNMFNRSDIEATSFEKRGTMHPNMFWDLTATPHILQSFPHDLQLEISHSAPIRSYSCMNVTSLRFEISLHVTLKMQRLAFTKRKYLRSAL